MTTFRDTSAFTTLDNANMSDFEKWAGDNLMYGGDKWAAGQGWSARQHEIDALKEELNSWRNTAAERTMQKASLLDELVTLKAENERLRKACSKAATWLAGNSIDDTAHESWRKTAKLLYEEMRATMTAPDTKGE